MIRVYRLSLSSSAKRLIKRYNPFLLTTLRMSNFDALEDQFLTTYVPLLELNRPGCTSGDPQGLPPLNRDSFINTWTPIMESEFSGLLIPNGDWAYGGMLYLPQSFKIVIKWKRRKIRQRSGAEWTWNDFKEAVVWALG